LAIAALNSGAVLLDLIQAHKVVTSESRGARKEKYKGRRTPRHRNQEWPDKYLETKPIYMVFLTANVGFSENVDKRY
jgi:hypothetical protein